MPKFFINENQIIGDVISITGDDAHHISRSLRMAAGEYITACDNNAVEYNCILEQFLEGEVRARIVDKAKSLSELPVKIHLFQALPKGEKLDFIVQKAIECGAFDITPFKSERCVVKVKADAESRKTERRNKIALEAAKQCGRGIVPTVNPTVSFDGMLSAARQSDVVLFCYEGKGTMPMGVALKSLRSEKSISDISIIIGSEGGFSEREASIALECGFMPIGLGNRILRAETAAVFALSCAVYEFELT